MEVARNALACIDNARERISSQELGHADVMNSCGRLYEGCGILWVAVGTMQ